MAQDTEQTEKKEKKVDEIKAEASSKGCAVEQAIYYVKEFLAGPMCGRCFPCSMGVFDAMLRLKRLRAGTGAQADIDALKRISEHMAVSSMCKKGKDTAKFIADWIAQGEFDSHLKGICPARTCKALVIYEIDADKCTMCGLCLDACRDLAIEGEKAEKFKAGYMPFEVRLKRCTRCDECRKVCPFGAVMVYDMGLKAAQKQEAKKA